MALHLTTTTDFWVWLRLRKSNFESHPLKADVTLKYDYAHQNWGENVKLNRIHHSDLPQILQEIARVTFFQL